MRKLNKIHLTVEIQNFEPDRFRKTVLTQILEEQSDYMYTVCHCLCIVHTQAIQVLGQFLLNSLRSPKFYHVYQNQFPAGACELTNVHACHDIKLTLKHVNVVPT